MASRIEKQELIPGVYWVGVVDWAVRIFHGYHTDEGSSYNAYLLMDEKPTLIDGVKKPFSQEYLERVSAITPLESIQYIIVNHAEGDHASNWACCYDKFPNATFVGTAKCKEHCELLYGMKGAKWQIVDAKSELCTGKNTFKFVPVPMLHWPDSMFTYCVNMKALFSNDGFGQHYATSKRWADECEIEHVMQLFKEYTATILALFGAQIRHALQAVSPLQIDYIFTSHGVNWRGEHVGRVVGEYSNFASGTHIQKKVTIFYDSMYGATDRLALAIAEGARSSGCETQVLDLKSNHVTKVAVHCYDSAAVAVGSPTLNNGMMPTVQAALNLVHGLTLVKGKPAFAFGFFGWSQRSVTDVVEQLKACKAEVYDEKGLSAKFNYTDELLAEAFQKGVELGKKALAKF